MNNTELIERLVELERSMVEKRDADEEYGQKYSRGSSGRQDTRCRVSLDTD